MKTYTTKGGKELKYVRDPKSTLFNIEFSSGGKLPQGLTGVFTSEIFAQRAIETYLSNQDNITKSKEK
jgi:hypothetical protein